MHGQYKAIAGALSLAILSNLFMFRSLGTTAIAIAIFLFIFYITVSYDKKKQSSTTILLTGWSIFFLFLSVIRSTPLIQALLVVSSLSITMLIVYLLSSGNTMLHALREILLLPFTIAGSYLSAIFDRVFSATTFRKKENTTTGITKHIAPTFAGLTLGVPVVFFLVFLLSQADPIFGKTVTNILDQFSLSHLGIRIIVTMATFFFLLPWAYLSIKSRLFSTEQTKLPSTMKYPMTIVMGLIGLTLGAFLIIQWPYVFARVAAETDLSKYGIATYSEYVKRGFIEFLFIAGILYSLIWGGLLASRGDTKKLSPLRIVQSFVVGLFFVFLLSIARRILLYWDFHGLSLVRIYGGMFLIWIGFLTLIVWLRHFFTQRFVAYELYGTLIFISLLGVWNAETFIFAHHPPTVNNQIDTVYLSRLSSDGYPAWIAAFERSRDQIETILRKETALNAEDLRVLAYAGISLGQFTNNYHSLITRYGTPAERAQYQQSLFRHEAPHLNETASIFEQDLRLLQLKGNQATVSAASYVGQNQHDPYNTLSSTITTSIPDLRLSASIAAEMTENSTSTASAHYALFPRSSRSMGNFEMGTCSLYYPTTSISVMYATYCSPSFYVMEKYQKPPHKDSIDTLFTWNYSALNAFTHIRRDIPLDELLRVQDEYRQLWKDILRLPPESRKFSLDVSFDAPFLESLD